MIRAITIETSSLDHLQAEAKHVGRVIENVDYAILFSTRLAVPERLRNLLGGETMS